MFKLKWYVLVGVLGYLAFVLANIPASFVVKQLAGSLKQNDIVVTRASGTLWSGSAVLTIRQADKKFPVVAEWQLRAWKLLLAQLAIKYRVEGEGFELKGDAGLSPGTATIGGTQGYLSPLLINNFTASEGIEISGQVELQDFTLQIDIIDKKAEAATGELYWGGGEVVYKQGNRPMVIDFPALKGIFSEKEGSLGLVVTSVQDGKVVANVEIAPTGWAKVAVMKRVLEMAGQMQVGAGGDKPLIEVKQKLF